MTAVGGMAKERRHFASQEEFNNFAEGIWAEYRHTFGKWEFNWATGMVTAPGVDPIHVTERESDVLRVLINSMPNPLTMKQLDLELQRRYHQHSDSNNTKVYVRRLRLKIGAERIVTDESGYRFVPFPERGML